MKNSKIFLAVFMGLIALIVVVSCGKEIIGSDSSNPDLRTANCSQEIKYNTKVNTFVMYDAPDDQLTETEQMLKLPKSEYFEYNICKKSDGTLKSEIKAKPELATPPIYEPNTLGVPVSLKWRMVKDNGTVTIFDELDQEIETYTTVDNGSVDDLSKVKEYSLIPATEYEQLVQIMKQKMNIHDFSQDVFVVTNMVNGLKTETYIDKRYQKEVVVASYNANNVLETKNSYLYSISNNKAKMTNEIFETYKKSIDSNKKMTIVELTEYIYN